MSAVLPGRPKSEAPSSRQEGFWEGKLGYPHAWVVCTSALAMGFILHLMTGPVPSTPWTLALLSLPLLASVVFVRVRRHSTAAQWLSGIPLAVVATTLALLLALAGGVVPLSSWNRLGLPSLWVSWPFVMISLVVMTSLSASSAKRAWPMTRQNALFLLSHLGLLITMIGAAGSSVFMDRSRIAVFEEVVLNKSQDESGASRELPFGIKLKEFILDTFPATLAVAERSDKVHAGAHLCKTGMKETLGGWSITVDRYIHKSVFTGEVYEEKPWKTAAPAALVTAVGPKGERVQGWVSSGSMDVPSSILPLGKDQMLAMPTPRPKKFRSDLVIVQNGKEEVRPVEVNAPITVGEYQLFQLSYDEKMGAASEYSVLEVVRDRGLPVVYLGMFMLLAAVLWHLWEGVGKTK